LRRRRGAFAREEWLPQAPGWDEARRIPGSRHCDVRRSWGSPASMSATSLGGSGLGRMDATIIFEELAAALRLDRRLHDSPQHGGVDDRPALALASSARNFLPKLMTMAHLASYCLTEPGSGSDAAAASPPGAVRDGDDYVLNGTKAFHLRSFGQRPLRDDGAHRRGRAKGHFLPRR